MGMLIIFAILATTIAVFLRYRDRLFNTPSTDLNTPVTEYKPNLGDPISVDEFFIFRWDVHRCTDVVLQTEAEGGGLCIYCGGTGPGSSSDSPRSSSD